MGEVRWTAEAESWLREIHDYIAQDNPSAARGIYEKAQNWRTSLRSDPATWVAPTHRFEFFSTAIIGSPTEASRRASRFSVSSTVP